MFQVILG